MGVKGIGHTAYNVKDMEKTLAFYKDTFGFEKAFETNHWKTGKPWIVYVHIGGNQFMEFFYGGVNEWPYKDENIGYAHICLEVSDIGETWKRIVESGAPQDAPPRRGGDGNWQCWTHDPDGNRIELMQMMPDSKQKRFLDSIVNERKIS